MATWIAVGCASLALLGAVIRARQRRNPRHTARAARDFLARLRECLEARSGVRFRGVVAGRFTGIIEVDGQETPVPLHGLLRHFEAFPAGIDLAVGHLIEEIRADALDRPEDHPFSEVANDLLPQVRSVGWLASQAPALGDGALVHRRLGTDLAVCYVIDDAWSMVFICRAHLRQWGRSEEDLFQLARRNLALRTQRAAEAGAARDRPCLATGDGYDAARAVLLDPDHAEGLLVALPERDVLWVEAGDEALAELMADATLRSPRATESRSLKLYRLEAGEPCEVGAGADGQFS
jgi:hypothetical protein